jgi:hypothetical protein
LPIGSTTQSAALPLGRQDALTHGKHIIVFDFRYDGIEPLGPSWMRRTSKARRSNASAAVRSRCAVLSATGRNPISSMQAVLRLHGDCFFRVFIVDQVIE